MLAVRYLPSISTIHVPVLFAISLALLGEGEMATITPLRMKDKHKCRCKRSNIKIYFDYVI